MSDANREFLSLRAAGFMLGVSERTVGVWAAAGELPSVVVNGRRRVPRRSLEAWLAEREQAATAAVRRAA